MMIMDYICIQKKMEEACEYSARDYDRKNLDGDMTLVFCGCVNLICSLHSLDMLCVLCSAVYICGIAMLTRLDLVICPYVTWTLSYGTWKLSFTRYNHHQYSSVSYDVYK